MVQRKVLQIQPQQMAAVVAEAVVVIIIIFVVVIVLVVMLCLCCDLMHHTLNHIYVTASVVLFGSFSIVVRG